MVKTVIEKANNMLLEYGYSQEGIIDILAFALCWKLKGENLFDGSYEKETLIKKIKKNLQREQKVGDYFLKQVARINEKIEQEDSKVKAIDLFNNILKHFDEIVVDSIHDKEHCLDTFVEFIGNHTNYSFNYFTPPEIIKLMNGYIKKDIASLYDPFKRSGEFLIEGIKIKGDSNNIIGEGGNRVLTQVELLRKIVYNIDSDLKRKMTGNDTVFDCIITNPPFGKTSIEIPHHQTPWDNYISSKRQEYQILKTCLNKMSDKGKLAIILPDNFIFSNELKKFREKIIEDNLLDSIVLLPKVFYQSNVITCIVVFDYQKEKENVSVIDLRKDGERRKSRYVISKDIIQEVIGNNITKDKNSLRYRYYNKEDFVENRFNFSFIKKAPAKSHDINFQIEMKKLIDERKKINQKLENVELILNKYTDGFGSVNLTLSQG
jgi:type I restriction-modification system DNA methylase subunit